MVNRFKAALLGAAAIGMTCASVPAGAVNIILRPDSSFQNSPNGGQALFAFQKAANFWNTFLTGDTKINFNVSYRALATNVIASAGSTRVDMSVANVYQALGAKSASALDAVAVENLVKLTAAGGLGYRMPGAVTSPAAGTHFGLDTQAGTVFDNDDTYNNRFLYANSSNLRELGFTTDAAGRSIMGINDANITFSSAFNFDLDPTDGIDVGKQDFVSVAIHEMGHALGFVSGTDFYDFYGGNPATGGVRGPGYATGLVIDWDQESVASVWDLFRRSSNGPASSGFYTDPTDPNFGKRFLQLGPNRGAGFAPDGVKFYNASNEAEAEVAMLSTGRYNGDLQQASHWKDEGGYTDERGCFVSNRQIGVMDPTSGTCQPGIITANDFAAFDAMGYTLNSAFTGDILTNRGFFFTSAQAFDLAGIAAVPEPATWAMMIGGFGLVGATARRRKRIAVTFA